MTKKAWIVVDPLFGDGGKGACVDYLAAHHRAKLVVRYNGGAQAAHHVVAPNGVKHCFAMYGSGAFRGASTYLSEHVRVDLQVIEQETQELKALGVHRPEWNMLISADALVVTPFQVAASQHKNKTGESCGMGVGETGDYAAAAGDEALRMNDLYLEATVRRKLERMRQFYAPYFTLDQSVDDMALTLCRLADNYCTIIQRDDWPMLRDDAETIIFEGAQGMMLHPLLGTRPHTTSTDTSIRNALALLEGWQGDIETIGVLRAYMTRHGNGTFPTEQAALDVLPELDNENNAYQGKFRRGWLDVMILNYALSQIGGKLDGWMLSHLDYWDKLPRWKLAHGKVALFDSYRRPGAFIKALEKATGVPVRYSAHGPACADRQTYPQHGE